ncbi:hypothetical protein Tco_0763904 [Tanacetum coccineum]
MKEGEGKSEVLSEASEEETKKKKLLECRRCQCDFNDVLQLYMNKDEVVKTLLNRGRMAPGFTVLVPSGKRKPAGLSQKSTIPMEETPSVVKTKILEKISLSVMTDPHSLKPRSMPLFNAVGPLIYSFMAWACLYSCLMLMFKNKCQRVGAIGLQQTESD